MVSIEAHAAVACYLSVQAFFIICLTRLSHVSDCPARRQFRPKSVRVNHPVCHTPLSNHSRKSGRLIIATGLQTTAFKMALWILRAFFAFIAISIVASLVNYSQVSGSTAILLVMVFVVVVVATIGLDVVVKNKRIDLISSVYFGILIG